jgi:hypothetical protein
MRKPALSRAATGAIVSVAQLPTEGSRMSSVGFGLIVLIFLVVAGYVIWRVKNGGEMEAGGSMGHQMFRRDDEDWGPKS